jgi:pimeloyl-ACP methyl ester carboxylesterase
MQLETHAMTRSEWLVDGPLKIHVRVDGAGPAVVLLPSSQRDSLDFDEVAQRIASAGYLVLRPQPRGMAGSQGPMDGLSLHTLARDVAWVIERLAGGPAIVAGHAFGHYIARVVDLDHPAWVRGVAVLAGAARVSPPTLSAALDTAADDSRPRADRLAALERAFFAPGRDASVWLEGWHPTLRTVYRQAALVPRKDVWWPASHSPILDLQAGCDPWRPVATRHELRDALGAQVTVQVIADASHALLPEQPAAVADAITQWARSLPTP